MSEPKELQDLRQERGLSVEELAEQSGVDAEIIRAIERGRWYQENDLLFPPPEENEILRRLMEALGGLETRIAIDMPPSLKPGDIVLGSEVLGLLPPEVIEANAHKIGIAVPDPETGELGLIWYESLTQADLDRIAEYHSHRKGTIEVENEKLRDHLARMQEMGLERDESWFDYEKKRQEEGQ